MNRTNQADLDLMTKLIKQGGPTYPVLTARSYHPGGVNTLYADGGVRFAKSTINGENWRALGTLRGGEIISSDGY